MNKILKNIAFAVVASLSFAACTDVDLCTNEEHPHLAVVELGYDWNGVEANDSMIVLPYRCMSAWGCTYICTPDGTKGRYISNAPDSTVLNDTLKVKAGELRFLTVSYDTNNQGFSYRNVLNSAAIKYGTINLQYRPYKLNSALLLDAYGKGIAAFENMGYNYILNGDMFNPIYSQYTDVMNISSGVNSIEFAPKSVLTNFDFNFDISAQGVTIDNIVAHLSGIPYRYNLTSEKPLADSTAAVLFDVNSSGASKYSGRAAVAGLLRAANSESINGAGILTLAISVTNGAGSTKVYKVATSLYNYIPGLENLLYGSDREFEIDAPIVITNNGVDVSAVSSTGARWFKM
ncbi:MAG: hypothetical protein J6J37_09920 [Bacteroidaceae bacterium]|nr:hypothetical protein [Bacteroidaceae bacterium]